MLLNDSIYDLRGEYPAEMNEKLAYYLAREARKRFPRATRVVVASDGRESSRSVKHFIMRSVRALDFGEVPLVVVSAFARPRDLTLYVTASHLGKRFTGVKLYFGTRPIGGKPLVALYRAAAKQASRAGDSVFHFVTRAPKRNPALMRRYFRVLARFAPLRAAHRIALDVGGSPLRFYIAELRAAFPRLTIGKVFNHKTPENPLAARSRATLAAYTRGHDALGVLFDSDADRVGFAQGGKFFDSDWIAALLILYAPAQFAAVLEPRFSRNVFSLLRARSHRLILSESGRGNLIRAMLDSRADFGAEISGHFYFKETASQESPLLAVLRILRIEEETGKRLSALVRGAARTHLARVNVPGNLDAVRRKVLWYYKGRLRRAVRQFDGIIVRAPDVWFAVKQSETEPLIRVTVEARSTATLRRELRTLKRLLRS